jgi:flagellar assembly protein FliH
MVESFILCPFDEESPPRDQEFVSDFQERAGDGDELLAIREEPVDMETQARKVFEDAFAQGEKAGHEMGLKRVEPLVKRLNLYISELEALKGELMERSGRQSVELALIFAEAIILRSCAEKGEIIKEMSKKALEICEGQSGITIRVRPDDAQYVSGDASGFVKVVPDDTILEPGFVIETSFGDIDGRISTQIEELRKRVCE